MIEVLNKPIEEIEVVVEEGRFFLLELPDRVVKISIKSVVDDQTSRRSGDSTSSTAMGNA